MSEFDQRIAQLSPEKRELLRRASIRGRTDVNRIRPMPRPERVPLSFGQQRLWLLDQFSPGVLAYNSPFALWLEGDLNVSALHEAMQSIVARHEVLRTVYRTHAGLPYQHVLPVQPLQWLQREVVGDNDEAKRAMALRMAREEVAKPFSLANDLPVRATLLRVTGGLHLLVVTFHHIAIDGWSIATLRSEIASKYNALCEGNDTAQAPTSLQIADIALWQRQVLDGDTLQSQLAYWKRHLTGAPAVLDLPADRSRPAAQSFNGAVWVTDVPESLYARLQTLARESQVTLSILFLAALQALLARYSGQEHVVVAMGASGRNRLELESVVGFFVNMLPMHADLSDDPEFEQLLLRTRDSMLHAMDNADAPLDRILEELRVPRSASHTPFAQVMYFFQNYPDLTVEMSGLRVHGAHLADIRAPVAQGDVSLFVNQHHERELIFEYSTDLYDESRIRRMAGHLLAILEFAAEHPRTRLSALPLLTVSELAQQAQWNATERALPAERTIASAFSAQVGQSADSAAVIFDGRVMTYAELDRRASAVARKLHAQGIGPGSLVCLYVDRSLEMMIGLFGIVKSGAAYVPLDPSFPEERLAYMIEMSASNTLVTQAALAARLPAKTASVLVVDANDDGDAAAVTFEIHADVADPAYVIFTSGSTGKPKGVEIRQDSAVNLMRSISRQPGMSAGDKICAISTLSFDIALTELVLPLTVGATVLLVDQETVRDGLRLRAFVETQDFNIMQATPATWRMLLDVGWRGKTGLKIISTGEALPRELADRLLACGDQLWNLYGPTETTVYSALCKVEADRGPIMVGCPVDNTQLYIVDRNMQRLPVGVPGELLIGGAGLATGYLGRPDLTSEKFVADPFSQDEHARLYRTGDLALWREDGYVQVIGRIDHQIKLRGFRIELGEIETVLGQYHGLDQVVVHCREDRPGDPRLVAYYTLKESAAPDDQQLREFLRKSLPEYMIPSAYVPLAEFALTPNGKVDRRALPAPRNVMTGQDERIDPRSSEEREIATVWCELLQLDEIDMRTNFFNAGGHSLLATQMLSRIQSKYGVQLSLRALFESPTLEQFAARVTDACAEFLPDDLERILQDLERLSEAEAAHKLAEE